MGSLIFPYNPENNFSSKPIEFVHYIIMIMREWLVLKCLCCIHEDGTYALFYRKIMFCKKNELSGCNHI